VGDDLAGSHAEVNGPGSPIHRLRPVILFVFVADLGLVSRPVSLGIAAEKDSAIWMTLWIVGVGADVDLQYEIVENLIGLQLPAPMVDMNHPLPGGPHRGDLSGFGRFYHLPTL